MLKFINAIKQEISSLMQYTSLRRKAAWLTTGVLTTCAGLWHFPLDRLSSTGNMPPDTQWLIRMIGTESLLALWLIALNRLAFHFYEMNKPTTATLTEEELDHYKKILGLK